MAARKLQSEIDRTLKKVTEGVESFESIYDKMHQSTNQTQKEKLESDLKTQIKKLQRLRDQIKTWAASNDIKDKAALQDNRKLIETQMERFKACEKEMKTKAFSKGGLAQATRLDPREKAKHEQSEWLGNMVAELDRQVEVTEAELATLVQTGKKKSKSGANGRADDLQHLNTRRRWHVMRLEKAMRLLENGTLTPDQIQQIRPDVGYFVETNGEEDFEEDEQLYDELRLDDEEEFGALNGMGDAGTEDGSSIISDFPPPTPLKAKGPRSSSHDDDPPISSPVLRKQSITLRKPVDKPEPPKAPIPQPNFTAQPMSSALKAGLTAPSSAPVKPAMRYAAAAGGAASTQPPIPPTPTTSVPPSSTTAPSVPSHTASSIPPSTPASSSSASVPPANAAYFPSRSPTPSASNASPVASSIMPPSQTSRFTPPEGSTSVEGSQYQDSRVQSPDVSPSDVASVTSPFVPSMAASPFVQTLEPAQSLNGAVKSTQSAINPSGLQQPQSATAPTTSNGSSSLAPGLQNPAAIGAPPNLNPSPLPQQVQQFGLPSNNSASSLQAAGGPPSMYPPGVPIAAGADRERNAQAGSVGSHLAQQQHQPQQQQSQQQSQQPSTRPVLPGSLGDLVQSFEQVKSKAAQRMSNPDQVNLILEKSIGSTPQAHDTEKPKYYVARSPYNTPPYYPQTPLPNLSSPTLFGQLDVETLFYVFYFLPGTYLQYLAAHELKKQSWRFHVKYLTWFQRHSEPQAITEEYEQGVYVYFDWEGSWCQRKKSDFRFEYRYLSED